MLITEAWSRGQASGGGQDHLGSRQVLADDHVPQGAELDTTLGGSVQQRVQGMAARQL